MRRYYLAASLIAVMSLLLIFVGLRPTSTPYVTAYPNVGADAHIYSGVHAYTYVAV